MAKFTSGLGIRSIFDKFRDFITWTSLDGFTVGGDAGYYIGAYSSYLVMNTPAVINNDANIYSTGGWRLVLTGKIVTYEVPLSYLDVVAQITWIRFAQSAGAPPSETTDHFGWKIIDGNLYASNANNTTQTITDTGIDISTGYQTPVTRLKIMLTDTNCQFYVNDVLKVTHTSNLPRTWEDAGARYYFDMQIRTTDADLKSISVDRVLIEQDI